MTAPSTRSRTRISSTSQPSTSTSTSTSTPTASSSKTRKPLASLSIDRFPSLPQPAVHPPTSASSSRTTTTTTTVMPKSPSPRQSTSTPAFFGRYKIPGSPLKQTTSSAALKHPGSRNGTGNGDGSWEGRSPARRLFVELEKKGPIVGSGMKNGFSMGLTEGAGSLGSAGHGTMGDEIGRFFSPSSPSSSSTTVAVELAAEGGTPSRPRISILQPSPPMALLHSQSQPQTQPHSHPTHPNPIKQDKKDSRDSRDKRTWTGRDSPSASPIMIKKFRKDGFGDPISVGSQAGSTVDPNLPILAGSSGREEGNADKHATGFVVFSDPSSHSASNSSSSSSFNASYGTAIVNGNGNGNGNAGAGKGYFDLDTGTGRKYTEENIRFVGHNRVLLDAGKEKQKETQMDLITDMDLNMDLNLEGTEGEQENRPPLGWVDLSLFLGPDTIKGNKTGKGNKDRTYEDDSPCVTPRKERGRNEFSSGGRTMVDDLVGSCSTSRSGSGSGSGSGTVTVDGTGMEEMFGDYTTSPARTPSKARTSGHRGGGRPIRGVLPGKMDVPLKHDKQIQEGEMTKEEEGEEGFVVVPKLQPVVPPPIVVTSHCVPLDGTVPVPATTITTPAGKGKRVKKSLTRGLDGLKTAVAGGRVLRSARGREV